MSLNYEKIMEWSFPDIYQSYDWRDTVIYALGLGLGVEPVDKDQLRFVYEKNLVALPTMGTVLGNPGPWIKNPETGVDWTRTFHTEQDIAIHQTLPPKGRIIGRNRVIEVLDKKEKGAVLRVERTILNEDDGSPLCTMVKSDFCRSAGGFGGSSGPSIRPNPIPDRKPDVTCDLSTLPQAALIFRLCGDYNPLHVDPDVAKKAGFERPILHGMGTFGIAGYALLKTCCNSDPDRLKRISARFSAPFYPGETLRSEFWHEDQRIIFRAIAVERRKVVLNNGYAEVLR